VAPVQGVPGGHTLPRVRGRGGLLLQALDPRLRGRRPTGGHHVREGGALRGPPGPGGMEDIQEGEGPGAQGRGQAGLVDSLPDSGEAGAGGPLLGRGHEGRDGLDPQEVRRGRLR
jgi:hypothetical protein